MSDLNCHTTIERVARRLPRELQQRWVEKAAKIYDTGRDPLFEDLADFVAERARIASCPYNTMLNLHDGVSRASTSSHYINYPKDKLPGGVVTKFNVIKSSDSYCPL